jgi:hypothetical protein
MHDSMTATAGPQVTAPTSSSLPQHLAQKLSKLEATAELGQITPSSFTAATVLVHHFFAFVMPLFPDTFQFAAGFMVSKVSNLVMDELQYRGKGVSGAPRMEGMEVDEVVKLVAFELSDRVEFGYTRLPYEQEMLEVVAARCVRND